MWTGVVTYLLYYSPIMMEQLLQLEIVNDESENELTTTI
jgi:hypothetical protein